jgi:hypothetical protein
MSIWYPTLAGRVAWAHTAIEDAASHDISESPYADEMADALARAEAGIKDAQAIARKHQTWVDEQPAEPNEAR